MSTFAVVAALLLVACSEGGVTGGRADAVKINRDGEAPTDAAQGSAEAGRSNAGEDAAAHSPYDASSSNNAMPVPLARDEFVRVTADFSGGFCDPTCPILKRSVEADGVLVLEDEKGMERLELSSDEYESVLAIVLDPAFLRALRDPSDCHGEPDVGSTIEVMTKGAGLLTDSGPASCINGRTESDHIYNRLVWLLIDLQKAHMDCSEDTPTAHTPGRTLCGVCNIEAC